MRPSSYDSVGLSGEPGTCAAMTCPSSLTTTVSFTRNLLSGQPSADEPEGPRCPQVLNSVQVFDPWIVGGSCVPYSLAGEQEGGTTGDTETWRGDPWAHVVRRARRSEVVAVDYLRSSGEIDVSERKGHWTSPSLGA